MRELFKRVITKIYYYKNALIVLCSIYFVALSALIRANFLYVDDLARVAKGYRGWDDFGRYISNSLSSLLHGGLYLTDVSPLTQLLAALIMSLAGICLMHVFADGKRYTLWSIIAVLPMGLSPYFLECFSFKFDSPYMAISVLASIVPIIFIKCKKIVYAISSVLGMLIMCMTYQASSGIYPMVVLFLAWYKWNNGKVKKEIIQFVGISLGSYITAILAFYMFICNSTKGYIDISALSFKQLVIGLINNFYRYYSNVYHDFKKTWILLILIMIVSFCFTTIKNSVHKKWVAIIGAIVVVSGGFALSFGVYPLLKSPIYAPRAMYGFGIFITLIAIIIANAERAYLPKAVFTLLSWFFFVFSLTYGNALSEQARYTDFRVQMVINDLNNLKVMNKDTEKYVQLSGDIGLSPIINAMAENYPVLKRLVPNTFGALGGWTEVYFFEYFDFRDIKQYSCWNIDNSDLTEMNLPIVSDTMYHTIKAMDEYILIELK